MGRGETFLKGGRGSGEEHKDYFRLGLSRHRRGKSNRWKVFRGRSITLQSGQRLSHGNFSGGGACARRYSRAE